MSALKPHAVVGIWDGHDAGAALIIDGHVVMAINEERLTNRKLEIGWPKRSLEALHYEAGSLWDTTHFAITTSDPAKTLGRVWPASRERYYRLRRRLDAPSWSDGLTRYAKYRITQLGTCSLLAAWTKRYAARKLSVDGKRVSVVGHHAAHAASACYWPDWSGEALVVTLDGIGDGLSGSVWRFNTEDGSLTPELELPGSASLGLFFEHVTEVLQMRALEDEGKVMALASFTSEIRGQPNPFAAWFQLMRSGPTGLPVIKCMIPPARMRREVEHVAWRMPREQVCRSAQSVLEHIVPGFFQALSEATGIRQYAYAGGVASNIKVNRLIRLLPGVSRLMVCPAMGDGGLALGAALFTWRQQMGTKPEAFSNFLLGPRHGNLGLRIESRLQAGEKITRPDDVAEYAAKLVAAGDIIMWAQGRMELGARALGARSIVARADSVPARDALNLRLKRRVWYQPFCPSILESEARRLLADFRGPADFNRHMTMGFITNDQGRESLAGAIGPDGSCRPQMVQEDTNDPWYRLLAHIQRLTGVGAVINTSLNIHGKPMPDSPEAILQVWRDSGVPYLILGDAALSRATE